MKSSVQCWKRLRWRRSPHRSDGSARASSPASVDRPRTLPCPLLTCPLPVHHRISLVDFYLKAAEDTLQTVGVRTLPAESQVLPQTLVDPCSIDRRTAVGWQSDRATPARSCRPPAVRLGFDLLGIPDGLPTIQPVQRRVLLFSLRCLVCREPVHRDDRSGTDRAD